ncbi:unnamed protein product [Diatraea saccharalis]|uniref:Uncharacterized protein n=1 Tax=Diatraea saccharalis TaxID=40085 RepID=A0A9N9R441_9NEOP|nr:unnamed protein product [Diatraea saccharalis]
MGSYLPTCGGCRRGCCHGHGYGHAMPNAGEPYPGNINRPCMGHCNPPKLYADTYSYLNNHLMQPVVQEVYNDLKTITPANTIMNNPMASKMGLEQNVTGMNMMQNNDNHPTAGNIPNEIPNMSENMNSMSIQQTHQPMNNMGGMGPEIAKMILGDSGPKQNNQQIPVQGRQLEASMISNVRQSPQGNMGVTGMNPSGQMYTDVNQGYTSNQNQSTANMNQTQYQQPTPQQFIPIPHSATNTNNNFIPQNQENMPMRNTGNSAAQQMGESNQRAYAQHTQGVMKFNQMFPGVMQGGDLGFDPMAIAIQMNPANQQKAAMETMQKLMNGTPINKAENLSAQPPANIAQPPFTPTPQNQNYLSNNQQFSNQPTVSPSQNLNQQIIPMQQQIENTNAVNNPITTTQHSPVPQHQQQIYSVVTDSTQQHAYQKPSDLQNQQMPESGIPTTQPVNLGINNPNTQMQVQPAPTQYQSPETQQITKDPILPVDTSRNQPSYYVKPKSRYEFNTLGQPVQMLPAQVFHEPEPRLPQTLSPQPIPSKLRNNQNNYSNVKSTVSKTSIIGKGHIPRAVSKSQLQHLYNQYKGSQSFTQQNVTSPVQAPTHSDGKLNIVQPNTRPQQLIPVEKFGGDNNANNVSNNIQIPAKVQKDMEQVGDVLPSNKPNEVIEPAKATPTIPTRQAKLRNGLQDVVYTSYPSSAAWSFHGANDYRPVPARYRFREFK